MLNLGDSGVAAIEQRSDIETMTDTLAEQCRLCHRYSITEFSPNIFEAKAEFCDEAGEQGSIADVCYLLLGIQYEHHEYLPDRMCLSCLEFLKDFSDQRNKIHKLESELQQQLKLVINLDPKYRPGLNGNAGVFEPDDNCVIIDVDPDQLCETSDDDLMVGTDADEEEDEEEDDEVEAQIEGDNELTPDVGAGSMQTLIQTHQLVDATTAQHVSNPSDLHPKSAFLCQYCDLAFTLQTDCQQHELTSHDVTAPYSCTYCQLRLTTRPALISHIKEQHDAERPFVCALCNKSFCRRSDLKKHTIVHTGVRPYTCNVCSKSFSRNTNLTKHMRIHSSVKPFVCNQCPRSFQSSVELIKHTRSHSDVKPYQCLRCPSAYSRKDKLLLHQQSHDRQDNQIRLPADTDILPLHPYVDTEAAQLQYQQQQLQQLQQQQQQLQQQYVAPQVKQTPKSHSKSSRNFRCDVCDKSFQRERDLQRHRALHMDTLFACKICGLGFARREKLMRHEVEAHGPSYTCSVCCISFLQQSELEVHFKVHELQHNTSISTQEAMNAVTMQPQIMMENPSEMPLAPAQVAPPVPQPPPLRPTPAEMSFYSNMIPTMNLGFYSETRPEERNGV